MISIISEIADQLYVKNMKKSFLYKISHGQSFNVTS